MKEKNQYLKWGLTAFLTACAILVFYDIYHQGGMLSGFFVKLTGILAPVLYGAAMAYLLAPLINWFERVICLLLDKGQKKAKKPRKRSATALRAASIILTWALVLLLIYLLMAMLVPQLVESISLLAHNLRSYYEQVYTWTNNWLKRNPEIGGWANDALEKYYQDALDYLTKSILPRAQELATSLTGGIWSGIWGILTFAKNMLIGLIVSVYLLGTKEKSLARCCKALYAICAEKTADLIACATHKTDLIFAGFVRGKIVDSAIIGVLCLIGCSILRIPYTPLISVIVGVTNVIPFFGPFIGAVPSAFLVLLVDPLKCLYFVIFVFLLQQLDGNVVGPKILGDTTGVSSFWVIVAILVGGGFGGVLGMFIGVPVCACLQSLVRFILDGRLQKRKMSTEAADYVGRGWSDAPKKGPSDKS